MNTLLWRIAGANIKILSECETSQKQYANIGAVILMTACVAFCAGTFAAYYFSCSYSNPNGNLPISILFGILWSLLIFCIDRVLVVTLQKKEKRGKTWWIFPFFSRFFLAAIIASMISIPIELFIFEDYIKGSEKLYLSMKDSIYIDKYQGKESIKFYENLKSSRETERVELNGIIGSLKSSAAEEDVTIQNLKQQKGDPYTYSKSYKIAYDSYTAADRKYENSKRQYYKNNRLIREAYNNKESKKEAAYAIKRQWEQQKEKEITLHNNIRDSLQRELVIVSTAYEQADSLYKDANGKYTERYEGFINEIDKNRTEIQRGNSFMRNFDILEWAVSTNNPNNEGKIASEGFFLWLIRLLFLIIEILPTIVKIATPYGEYDALLEAVETQKMGKRNETASLITSKENEDLSPEIMTDAEHNL